MKIIQNKNKLPKPCQICRKLMQGRHKTRGTIAFKCKSGLHFPTNKNLCKREDMKAGPLFKKFLRDSGICEKYFRNFDLKFNDGITKIYHPFNYIESAFKWRYTKEGYIFWRAWHDKWVELLKQRK